MDPRTHTTRVERDGRIELILPDVPEGALVRVTVDLLVPTEGEIVRRPGSARGKIRIADDFDDPLEEFEGEKY